MTRLIELTQVGGPSMGTMEHAKITVNVMKILWVEDTHEHEVGEARIVMENGKSLYVEEDQAEIREMANEGAGGGLMGRLNVGGE